MNKEHILSYLSAIKSELMQNGIAQIGLFGSFANNHANRSSDIDIAIKLNPSYLKEHDVWEYFTLLETIKKMLSSKFSRKVDLYDLDSNNEINQNINKDVIYV